MHPVPIIALLLAVVCLVNTSVWAAEPVPRDHPIGRDSLDAALPGGARLQVELWYPAQPDDGTTAPWGSPDYLFTPALKDALVEYVGMPRMAISTKEKGQGRRDVPVVPGPWPLVVFSHGFASFSRQNSRQAEALAQAGYIVAALSHPGESLTTEYADGRVQRIDDSHPALQYMGKRAKKSELLVMAREMNTYLQSLAGETSPAAYLSAMQALNDNTLFGLYQTSAEVRSTQLVQWLQLLIATAQEDRTQLQTVLGEADLQRIALYGHSLGGVVSVAASQALHRQGIEVSAVVNLDAPQFLVPEPGQITLNSPTCFLMGGSTKAGKVKLTGTRLNSAWARNNPQVCEINIEGAAHNNFTDLSWISILKWFGQLGPVPNKKFGNWLNGFLVGYFDHHLKGQAYRYPSWPEAVVEGRLASE